jgi:hypothetical protein
MFRWLIFEMHALMETRVTLTINCSDLRYIISIELVSFHQPARWPSGLRRQLKVNPKTLVRKGVGSNPTLVTISFAILAVFITISKSRRKEKRGKRSKINFLRWRGRLWDIFFICAVRRCIRAGAGLAMLCKHSITRDFPPCFHHLNFHSTVCGSKADSIKEVLVIMVSIIYF